MLTAILVAIFSFWRMLKSGILTRVVIKYYNLEPVNSINTGTITPDKTLRLGEAKMAATTTNVVKQS